MSIVRDILRPLTNTIMSYVIVSKFLIKAAQSDVGMLNALKNTSIFMAKTLKLVTELDKQSGLTLSYFWQNISLKDGNYFMPRSLGELTEAIHSSKEETLRVVSKWEMPPPEEKKAIAFLSLNAPALTNWYYNQDIRLQKIWKESAIGFGIIEGFIKRNQLPFELTVTFKNASDLPPPLPSSTPMPRHG